MIYEINNEIRAVKHEETEHYQVMKNFINNTQGMLDILMSRQENKV